MDPYAVLGVSKTATDDEVKAAYRTLAKQYHPDNFADNPLQNLAAQKMQEINDAYDQIMNERKGTGNGFYANDESSFADIRSMISAGRVEEAMELLDGVPPAQRNAEWYFLNGSVMYRRGWFDNAYTSFSTACRMNPGNEEYRAAFENIKRERSGFDGYRQTNNPQGCNTCDICSSLMCADCCCQCLGGGNGCC